MLLESQKILGEQFNRCKGEIENISAFASIPNDKLAIITQKMEKLPRLQTRV